MRLAKTLDDLPVGTPIEVEGIRITWKGIVCYRGYNDWAEKECIKILYSDGDTATYYEEDLKIEGIMIVEVK